KIQFTDFRLHLQMNQPVRLHRRREVQLYTERAELNSNHRSCLRTASSRRNHRKRKLAARQKTRFMAADGNEIRFGEDFEQVFVLQQFQCGADIEVRTEHEEI